MQLIIKDVEEKKSYKKGSNGFLVCGFFFKSIYTLCT